MPQQYNVSSTGSKCWEFCWQSFTSLTFSIRAFQSAILSDLFLMGFFPHLVPTYRQTQEHITASIPFLSFDSALLLISWNKNWKLYPDIFWMSDSHLPNFPWSKGGGVRWIRACFSSNVYILTIPIYLKCYRKESISSCSAVNCYQSCIINSASFRLLFNLTLVILSPIMNGHILALISLTKADPFPSFSSWQ